MALGSFGLGATYTSVKADRKVLEIQLAKERELRQLVSIFA